MPQKTLQHEIAKRLPFSSHHEEAVLGLIRSGDMVGRVFERLFRDHGLSKPQYNILRILRGHGRGLSCQEIGGQMLTLAPDITRLVDRLAEADLVKRERGKEDRRVVLIHITPAGKKILQQLDEHVSNLYLSTMEMLNDKEIKQLINLLNKLRENPLLQKDCPNMQST
ncbi:MarR family winged helix-turn-helix transcriptional regulator [Calycomorphotria hydatis]|uniref:HTH-type transcriptional regulator MgrA n=1 Tax=Calycomorphotria hydatis TaxID=2528027 RepID=A0A517TBA6_9PLAN|nr:MarR family transcriptional regulator [Calycomorphotria hydatis]QDT65661.1 HTH-type transcriptional regulator MgrA [Calycomorphotria hydatis]